MLSRLIVAPFAVAWLLAAHSQETSSRPLVPSRPSAQDERVAAQIVPGNIPLNALSGFTADYKIGANDLVDVEVFGVADLKRTVRVNSSGLVSLALVGPVLLVGLTAQEAEGVIAAKYGEKYLQDPQVSVFIREFTTQRVTIEGAVQRPGIYPLTGQITLLRAIALAGGGAPMANMNDIAVFRKNVRNVVEPTVFDLEKIRDGKVPDPEVLADDVIVVKRDATRTLIKDSVFRDILDTINPFSVFTR